MRILAIDVGTGTQDIMIYDTEKELENSIKLVLPSPHLYISQQIRETENDIYFTGEIMGGGKIKKSILEHMEKGYKVVMEPLCARTIRDDIEQVKAIGIEIADESQDYSDFTKIEMADINITKLSEFLLGYDLEFDLDKIAIAGRQGLQIRKDQRKGIRTHFPIGIRIHRRYSGILHKDAGREKAA